MILFTVSNELSYDQRMQRIADSLSAAGYTVLLVGRKRRSAPPLKQENYQQKRIRCLLNSGFAFYAEYNLRLFFFLLFQKAAVVCAIDLDTILPVYFASVIKKTKRVYDAHELFTEQKEIVTRPWVHQFWLTIERFAVPRFRKGYTVNTFIASELEKRYGVNYSIVRNLPRMYALPSQPIPKPEKWILYQGAVNEGRCFETLVPAMQWVDARLVICGNGNFFRQTQELTRSYALESKIELRGYIPPDELRTITPTAYIGITLFENTGLNQYYSLANRFFDYCMAGIPQICVNYPEYAAINQQYPIACLINNTDPETIAAALNNLLSNTVLYKELAVNCAIARNSLNWEAEQLVLLNFYAHL